MFRATTSILRRTLLGPCLLGLPVGIVIGVLLGLSGLEKGQTILELLVPVAALVSALNGLVVVDGRPFDLLRRTFLTSVSLCIPVPLSVWTLLEWRSGYELLDVRNFPLAAFLVVAFSLVGAVLGWLIALASIPFRNWYGASRSRSQ
jgi:hypothetical protein